MIDFGVAYDKLAQFECADDLADFLKGEGVKGWAGVADTCAIAKWMSDTTGQHVYVTGDFISCHVPYSPYNELSYTEIEKFPHTGATFEFIERFDDEEWPELMEEPEDDYWIDEY